jgi:hypothetical protein
MSPALPESAETASLPRDAPLPGLRSQLARILKVLKRTPRLFARRGLADSLFEHPARRECIWTFLFQRNSDGDSAHYIVEFEVPFRAEQMTVVAVDTGR